MVKGIDVFRRYFHNFTDQYVLIGGSACDLLFDDVGIDFRATKDLDLVLIVETLTKEFARQFWRFIADGGYRNKNRSGHIPQYYRFDKPQDPSFPGMIELFARPNFVLNAPDSTLMPIHMDDHITSLSAILLDEDHYRALRQGTRLVAGVAVLSPECLIAFKAKAYLDLKMKRENLGLNDNEDVRKHLRDTVRLSMLLTGEERPVLPEPVKADIARFIERYIIDPYDPGQLGLPITSDRFLELMRHVFQ